MNLDIIPAAQRDIAKAAEHYRQQREGLQNEFLEDVDASVERIVLDPTLFEQVRLGIRRCLLERFPYGVYYRTPDPDTVRIIIVRHHSRHPNVGMRRS
jgi:plasmid stabilization system protein ParE